MPLLTSRNFKRRYLKYLWVILLAAVLLTGVWQYAHATYNHEYDEPEISVDDDTPTDDGGDSIPSEEPDDSVPTDTSSDTSDVSDTPHINVPRNNGGAGRCLNCDPKPTRDEPTPSTDTTEPVGIPEPVVVQEQAVCLEPETPQGFRLETGTPNDNTLEVYWTPQSGGILVRFGNEQGVWTDFRIANNTGHFSLDGLTNGAHYWVSLIAYSRDGISCPTESIDPLP